MVTLLFYFREIDLINQTIDDLCDKTDIGSIDQIFLCNDSGQLLDGLVFNDLVKNKVEILDSTRIGRAKAWAIAADKAHGEALIFIGGVTKFASDWLAHLLAALDDNNIVSPQIHLLDTNLWQSLSNKWEKFGWRWDFQLCNRQYIRSKETLTVSSFCFAITNTRFKAIGGFDTGMDKNSGEDIEISYRNWIFGGKCIVSNQSLIATAAYRESASNSLRNINRIIQAWMPEYENNVKNYYKELPDAGKINNLLQLERLRVKSNKEILNILQPELFGVYDLRHHASGKSIAVIAPGCSFDYINKAMINRNDVIIGVDYVGMAIDCDWVVTDSVNVVAELKKKYPNEKLVTPIVIKNRIIGRYESAEDLCPGCRIFEQNEYGQLDINHNPPFIDVDNISITAVNLALFMNPSIIYLYGYDSRLLNGKSHSSQIGYYDDGAILPESESTVVKYNYYEYALHKIGDIGIAQKIPIIRINHL